MKKLLILMMLMMGTFHIVAQESNNGKQLWADSFLNKKAPELQVEKWLTSQPDTKGKFILIDFWATWCGPCRNAIPKLNELQKQFEKELVIIGISKETKEKVKGMTNPKIEYSSAIDSKATMATTLGVKGIPHVILIDPQGIVRWEGYPMLKGHELTTEVVKKIIEKYK